jgi:hypothetical protein
MIRCDELNKFRLKYYIQKEVRWINLLNYRLPKITKELSHIAENRKKYVTNTKLEIPLHQLARIRAAGCTVHKHE